MLKIALFLRPGRKKNQYVREGKQIYMLNLNFTNCL